MSPDERATCTEIVRPPALIRAAERSATDSNMVEVSNGSRGSTLISVGCGQDQHVVDQPGQPVGLLTGLDQGRVQAAEIAGGQQGQLHFALDDGHWLRS